MPAWRDQPPANLAALAAVVHDFAAVAAESPPPPDVMTLGTETYRTHCAECHGISGAGNGFAASELPIAPTDFRSRRASTAENLRVLTNGIEGTSMAPWTDRLSGAELIAVAQYVRTFFIGDAQ
jgi:mono/diheme cytochrome c family protein